ncbi:MAG: DUF4845 domain-containing protein [Pseudomonadota bacterium]
MHDSKQKSQQHNLKAQRGVSVSGLIIVLGIIIAVAMLALKIVPSMLEYKSISSGIAAAKAKGGSVQEMRMAFDKSAEINAVTTISGKDLMFTKVNGETEVSFDYDQNIPLFTDVALLIHYAGTTDKSGYIPEKAEQPK